jgi:TonB family protein
MRRIAEIGMAVIVATLIIGGPIRAAQNAEEIYEPGRNGISSPAVIKRVKAQPTQAARDAGLEGTVVLACIVRADGTVGVTRIVRSLDKKFGLDEAAMAAARQWIFEPARRNRDRQPVAVRVTIEIGFSLK